MTNPISADLQNRLQWSLLSLRVGVFIEIFRENPLIDAKRRRWDESE